MCAIVYLIVMGRLGQVVEEEQGVGKNEGENEIPTNSAQAMRMKSLDCSAHSRAEVKNCVIPDCPLYPYRMGHSPNRKGDWTQRGQSKFIQIEEKPYLR